MLIFCSSRKGCEATAKHVAKYLKQFSVNINGETEYPDIASALDALKKSPAGLDPVLCETLPSGVAYHHAGLTVCVFSHKQSFLLLFSYLFEAFEMFPFVT